ncbi:MAG TPA: hypothetical protein P5134_01960, partial [Bacteroidales bacterium]|nr:hypothetical protein [Bacteroidales bacterium]
MKDLSVGTRIEHFKYGEGIISKNTPLTYKVIFIRGGEIEFSKMSVEFNIIEENEVEDEQQPRLNIKEFEKILKFLLDKYQGIEFKVELGKKWEGGTMVLQPGNPNLKPKEM